MSHDWNEQLAQVLYNCERYAIRLCACILNPSRPAISSAVDFHLPNMTNTSLQPMYNMIDNFRCADQTATVGNFVLLCSALIKPN